MTRFIHQLRKKNSSDVLQWSSTQDETLLQSARAQGLDLPSSCENGTCRTCLLQCMQSNPKVSYTTEWPGLSQEERQTGFVLPCAAIAHESLAFEPIALLPSQFEKTFCVVFENDQLLVLDKPSGLLSVPGKGPENQDSLTGRVQAVRGPNVLSVHRLDQATSGLIVMAKGAEHHRTLSIAFANQSIQKRYLAVVSGKVEIGSTWKTIDLPIHAHWPDRPKRCVHADGKPSQTRFRVWANNEQCSLLEIEPLSGRTHQIRVHLQAIGHPIWGDRLYAPQEVASASSRLLLHAWRLTLNDPLSQEQLCIQTPGPLPTQPTSTKGHQDEHDKPATSQESLRILRALQWHEAPVFSHIGKP